VRIGFAQVGVTFDPEEVLSRARLGSFKVDGGHVQFLVIDPISLYREKQALSQKRNSPNDHAHFSLLREFLAREFVQLCTAYLEGSDLVAEQQQNLTLLLDFKNRALETAQDPRVRLRLAPLLRIDRPETKWIRSAFQF
jgi:hypothetical protein